jgi:hypothetical protein
MLNETFSGTASSAGMAFARSGGADRLLSANQNRLGLDAPARAGQGDGGELTWRNDAGLTPVERGELAGAADAEAAYRAGGGGRSPEQTRQVGEAFRRELDHAPAALATSAAPADRARYADLHRAGEMALLSSDVYQDSSNPALLPRGYSALSDAQAQRQFPGFTSRDDQSGFYSRVYHDRNTDTYVVVNRGTNDASAPIGILLQSPDGKTNGALLQGKTTRQADLAIANARRISVATGGRVQFAGHSLGGALASLQAMSTGKPATVFNPLGVNPRTAEQYHLDPGALDTQVRSYQVEGEPVATANRLLGLRTSSQTVHLASRELSWSANDGLQASDGAKDPHSMTAVIAGVLNGMTAAKSGER